MYRGKVEYQHNSIHHGICANMIVVTGGIIALWTTLCEVTQQNCAIYRITITRLQIV
jgi:hypothetical protein